jgi:hypothetical protein
MDGIGSTNIIIIICWRVCSDEEGSAPMKVGSKADLIIMHVYDVAAVHTTVLFGVDEFRDCGAGQAATILRLMRTSNYRRHS